jgi:hypothetical protein
MASALIGLWLFEELVSYIVRHISPDFFAGRSELGLPNSFWTVPPSILVLVLLGIRKIPWQVKLGLTIAYVFTITVIVAAGDVTAEWWIGGRRIDGLPWVSMWILLVPIVIAIPWRRQIGRALFLSAIPPLVLYLGTTWFDVPDAPFIAYLDFTVPSLIAVALGVILANMMYRLRREAHEAQQLGSYVLEEQIGSGGMGEVWRASHNMLVRPAAIKLIRPERLKQAMGTAEDSTIERFQLEAQATASLRSPHTVELYDFGVAEDGTLHYVMELLEGLDLERLVNRFGPLQPGRAVYLLEQVCDSLRRRTDQDQNERRVDPHLAVRHDARRAGGVRADGKPRQQPAQPEREHSTRQLHRRDQGLSRRPGSEPPGHRSLSAVKHGLPGGRWRGQNAKPGGILRAFPC